MSCIHGHFQSFLRPLSVVRCPFKGSYHCGRTKYVDFLRFPLVIGLSDGLASTIRIYKCNFSTCHKLDVFHLRLQSSPDDFTLLLPLDPDIELMDYRSCSRRVHWYFCKHCGVRCFAFVGTGETAEVGVDSLGYEDNKGGKTMRVWRPKKEGWKESGEGRNLYLSVNAFTLDQGQEGLDLREWTEKNWIWYLDVKHEKSDDRIGEPYEDGCY